MELNEKHHKANLALYKNLRHALTILAVLNYVYVESNLLTKESLKLLISGKEELKHCDDI